MKFLTQIILIVLLSYLGQLLFPFWIIAIVALIVGFLIQSNGFKSFLAGFIAAFLLWSISAYIIDGATHSILTNKVAPIFFLNTLGLVAVTGVIGGIVGGFGALTGSLMKSMLSKRR